MAPAASQDRDGAALKRAVTAAAVLLAAGVLWALRSMIVPAFVGGVLAYICRPLRARLERRLPRGIAVALLCILFGVVTLVSLHNVRAAIPSETAILELRVRALYALNHHYQAVMGLDPSWRRGNGFYWLAHRDLDRLIDRVSELLALTPSERAQLSASGDRLAEPESARNRLLDHERANVRALELRAHRAGRAAPAIETISGSPSSAPAAALGEAELAGLGDLLSPWIAAPLVFLFLLYDAEGIRCGLLRAVPNRLFEPTLAVLAEIDEALGNYVRGLFIESCAFGLTTAVLLTLVGVPLRWAMVIGIFTAASNVVPFMGFAVALVSGLTYALLAETVHPRTAVVTADTFAIWVVAAVVLAQLLDNLCYEPFVLARAVKLHPLVVVIGVAGGANLFGPAGMLLAIPVITVLRVLVASSARHLKAYGLV